MQYIINLDQVAIPDNVGLKAQKLHFLHKRGYRIPITWVCIWDADLTQQSLDMSIKEQLRTQLDEVLSSSKSYVARSSANLEDSQEFSFAGQFLTKLDIRGTEMMLEAICDVQASLQSDPVQAYLSKHNNPPDDLRMAVIIQEMIKPLVSGVSFSKNPITGMDEVIVEAVQGSGKDLVRGVITPYRWVYKWGEWQDKLEVEGVSMDLVSEVVSKTKSIAQAYGEPVDLEWVFDGNHLYWLQIREITALKKIDVYSNHISKEFMPGIIKPLVWSVIVPLVNGAWVELLKELIGDLDIDPMRLAKSFYYRVYFNMGVLGEIFQSVGLPRESIENLMGISSDGPDKPKMRPSMQLLRHLPKLLRFVFNQLGYSQRVRKFAPAAEGTLRAIASLCGMELSVDELMNSIQELNDLTQRVAHYNLISTFRMQSYNQLLRRQLAKLGVDYEGLNLTSVWDEKKQFDPNPHLWELNREFRQLELSVQETISCGGYEEFLALPGIQNFQLKVEHFFERFGHLSDSGNDFSVPLWRNSREKILKLITEFPSDKLPSSKQLRLEDLPSPGLRGGVIRLLYRLVRKSQYERESVNFLYGFGISLFQSLFLMLGDIFVQRDILSKPKDIYFLYLSEIKEALEKGFHRANFKEIIFQRQSEIELYRTVNPPNIIFGDQTPPIEPLGSIPMKGIPTSRGYYRGPIQVVRGLDDFDTVLDGCVLVIPYSDVGLTPLFTKAGAIVSEAGGILSHSSIVAREFGIPAVVSVPGACDLNDGLIIAVNGYTGELHIYEDIQGNK